MKRTRLKPIGRRKLREMEERQAFSKAVLERGSCERCGSRRMLHAHHILPVSRGGRHSPENGACLCFRCHRAVTDHTCEDWDQWTL